MSELICAREFAKSLLRQERERFCRALEDQQEEGVCYQWLRTMPVTKKFTCCQQLLNAFTRTYYLPFVYENPYAEGPFIQSMALYMKSPEKKTRKMYDTFHQKMTDYCHSVVGVLLGGTRGGRPLRRSRRRHLVALRRLPPLQKTRDDLEGLFDYGGRHLVGGHPLSRQSNLCLCTRTTGPDYFTSRSFGSDANAVEMSAPVHSPIGESRSRSRNEEATVSGVLGRLRRGCAAFTRPKHAAAASVARTNRQRPPIGKR
jgi:hypothetical protein